MSSKSRNATHRLLKELDTWHAEAKDEKGIERLGPVSDSEMLTWQAVINGRGIGCGYDS
jgi:peroxin-4